MANLALVRASSAITKAPPPAPIARATRTDAALTRAGAALSGAPTSTALARGQAPSAPPAVSLMGLVTKDGAPAAANFTLSAIDNTGVGKAVEALTGFKPSTIALALTAALVAFAPRSWRKTRARAAVVGTGATHAIAARAGAATPGAVVAALSGGPDTAGGVAPGEGTEATESGA